VFVILIRYSVFVILDLFLVPNIRPDIRTECVAGIIGTTMFSHVGQLYIAARRRFWMGYLYLRPEILSQMAHPRSLETVPLVALFRDAAKVRLLQGVMLVRIHHHPKDLGSCIPILLFNSSI
jgi:hypothetical protein